MVPGLLAVADAFGFCILNSILGGQALSSIANINWTCVGYYVPRDHKFHIICQRWDCDHRGDFPRRQSI